VGNLQRGRQGGEALRKNIRSGGKGGEGTCRKGRERQQRSGGGVFLEGELVSRRGKASKGGEKGEL